jgi:hypothetical protein
MPGKGPTTPGLGELPGLAPDRPAVCQSGPRTRHLRGNLAGVDLEALRADPASLDELPIEDLPALLERCAVEHSRVAAVERLAHARLARELPGLTRATEGLLTARQAARRLGVSPDYVRDHGEALGLAIPLDGVVRYDPAAIDRLHRRRQDQPPLD